MRREKRAVIAVDTKSGDRKIFESTYACAKELRVNPTNVLSAAINNGGVCNGWQIFDVPETIERRIKELQDLLEFWRGEGL